MPSKDPINAQANKWLPPDVLERLLATEPADRPAGVLRTVRRVQAAAVQRLAASLGLDPEVMSEKIPDDTLRRLKYPMFSHQNPDGTWVFTHDPGIIRDGVRALTATDHANGDIEQNAPRQRDASGKFIK